MRLLTVLIGTMFLAGCATTASKTQPVSQLETQVSDLQQRMEEQEKEIVDLKYEVKELSGKNQTVSMEENYPTLKPSSKPSVASASDLIKVDVSGVDVQKALKGAGVYNGKIDGKIGAKTKSAIVEFQKQHNLKADGVIGQKTWNELKQYLTE